MKPLSFKITSDHLLLIVLLSLLWGVADAQDTTVYISAATITATTATPTTTSPTTLATTQQQPPENVKNVIVLSQTVSSVTLMWDKVNSISTYILLYENGSCPTSVNTSVNDTMVTQKVSSLNAGTEYNFTLITVVNGLNSTGYNFSAVTVPNNPEEFKSVGQNETSITLQWKRVDATRSYVLNFKEDINVNAMENENVTYTVSNLTNGTRYDFTLFTVFKNVRSTGVNLSAVTAPVDTSDLRAAGQNETSITLEWKRVGAILTYVLAYNDEKINVTATDSNETVTYTVSPLNNGTQYYFTLYTVFGNVSSTGATLTAATQPRNTKEFKSVGQNETSITLQWKGLDANFSYVLNFKEDIDITATQTENVTYTVSNLTSGTRYDFTLFTVFANVRSTGVKLTAVTQPGNTDSFTLAGQNETSITLQWKRVDAILSYVLNFDEDINVSATQNENVTYTVSNLTSGTRYDFTLFTVFANVRSTGVNLTGGAVTAPENVKTVTVLRRVSDVTLMWDKVNSISTYILQYENGGRPTSVATSLNQATVSSLSAGTEYNFTVITVFEGVNSTGYVFSTVTAIDCASVPWHVSNSSIQGIVEGLFLNATATNGSQTHVSAGGRNVSFSGLYPGATYEISLVYGSYQQCCHNLTVLPPGLRAHCEYSASGYSICVVWDKPDGVWTSVELNVTGQTYNSPDGSIVIPGFSPAKTYEVSVASLSGTLRSSAPFVFQCSTDPRGVIAGSVFAVVLIGLLVCLVVFILLRRPDFISGSELTTKKSNAISVKVFAERFYQLSVDDNRGFSREYESLLHVGTEQTRKAALLPENKTKNRFTNVLPYDWCRVKLAASAGVSDYINASYMPGYNSSREYIATQGPLPATVNDFWRMVWEQKVRGIVMVTNCTEGGRTKCEHYWPADTNPRLCGELLVTIRSEEQEPTWTRREFSVKHRDTTEQRTVKHFHFTSWPDHGVPQCTEVLIQFRRLVRHHIEAEGTRAPTVVHCSAGVGRTGTIIALDVLLQQLDKKGAVDINGYVHKMRLNRPHMVQTESQYVFLHQCILDSLPPEEKTDEHIYENTDMIYANAAALYEFQRNTDV